MIDRRALMNAQQAVAAGLLGEGITIVYDAEVPRADLRARVMHARPLPEDVSEEDLLHLRADTDHEMGHFAWSDPDAIERSAKRPLLALAHNAIEDGFVERRLSARWLGVAQNLAQSNAKVSAEIKATAKNSATSRRERSLYALQFLALGETAKQVCERFGEDIAPNIAEIVDLLPQLAAVDDSTMALEAAQEVLARWCWGSKTRGKGGKKKKKDKTRRGSAAPELQTDENYRKREDKVASQVKKRSSVAEVRKKLIRAMKFDGATVYHPRTDDDVVQRLVIKGSARNAAPAFLRSVRSVAAPLRRRLLMEFRGVGQRVEHAHVSGELDRSVLHMVPLGCKNIFTREVPSIVVDADVTLLVDASGSMTDYYEDVPRIFTASQAAAAFSLVLDNLRSPHECLAFTTVKKFAPEIQKGFYNGTYQRVRPLRHLIVKSADQSFRQALPSFVALAAFRGCAENIDGEAVLWAAQRLAKRSRPGRRSFLFVFSDGEPASVPESAQLLEWHLRHALEKVEKAGITVLGVGIASNFVEKFYQHHLVIEDLTDLVGTSYNLIRQALRSSVKSRAGVT